MARVRSRWNQKDRERSIEDLASAMGVNIWRIASEVLLNLENEGFETKTSAQRLDVISEVVAWLLHMTDRLIYGRQDEEARASFVNALARHLVSLLDDNRRDAQGPGDYRTGIVELLNARSEEYAGCSFSTEGGPGFVLRRMLGEHVRDRMGARDNKWIPDYVIDLEAPRAMDALESALNNMLNLEIAPGIPNLPKGGVWGEG